MTVNTKAVVQLKDVNSALALLHSLGKAAYVDNGEARDCDEGSFNFMKKSLEASTECNTVAGRMVGKILDMFSPEPAELLMLPDIITDGNKSVMVSQHNENLMEALNEAYFKNLLKAEEWSDLDDYYGWKHGTPFFPTNDLPELSKEFADKNCVIYNQADFYRIVGGRTEKLIMDLNGFGRYVPWVNYLVGDLIRSHEIQETLDVVDCCGSYRLAVLDKPYMRLPGFSLKALRRMFSDSYMPKATELKEVIHHAWKPLPCVTESFISMGKDLSVNIRRASIERSLRELNSYSVIDEATVSYHLTSATEHDNKEAVVSYNTAAATIVVSNHIFASLLAITHVNEANKELV